MAVELEPLGVRGIPQPVKMGIEIGDSVDWKSVTSWLHSFCRILILMPMRPTICWTIWAI